MEMLSRMVRLGRGGFSAECDARGILWERVMADEPAAEIRQTWPTTSYQPKQSE